MRIKIITLMAVAIGLTSCEDVDTNKLLGITDDIKVETKVEENEEVTFEVGATEWEKTYVIDVDKDFPDYADKIKHVDFKSFLYQVAKFNGAGSIEGGKVEVYMADPNRVSPEVNIHNSFSTDLEKKTKYEINNSVKISRVKQVLEKDRRADFVFKVILDKPAPQGFSMEFKYEWDLDVSGDFSKIDLDGLKDKNNN